MEHPAMYSLSGLKKVVDAMIGETGKDTVVTISTTQEGQVLIAGPKDGVLHCIGLAPLSAKGPNDWPSLMVDPSKAYLGRKPL